MFRKVISFGFTRLSKLTYFEEYSRI